MPREEARSYTLGELAGVAGAELHGDAGTRISGVETLEQAGPGQITFLNNPRYRKYLAGTRASAVILAPGDLDHCATNALVSDNPYLAWARVLRRFADERPPQPGVHPAATVSPGARVSATAVIEAGSVVSEGATLGEGVHIGPNCVVGRNAVIGDGTRLVASVTVLDGVRIGRRCLLHPGVVVGSDGFGLARDGRRWEKVPQLGSVVLEDDVEVGANTTIDRGAIRDTVIRRGAKLDNLIQVAHNVEIGENTAIAACTGISGSTRIGSDCTLAGGVGLVGHIELADDVHVTAFTLVTHSLKEPGVYSSGLAAVPHNQWKRNAPRVKRLDELNKKVRELEKAIEQLRGEKEAG